MPHPEVGERRSPMAWSIASCKSGPGVEGLESGGAASSAIAFEGPELQPGTSAKQATTRASPPALIAPVYRNPRGARRSSVFDHGADRLTGAHEVERLVDPLER